MTLIELKDIITSGNVPTEFLIIVSKDNKFLSEQYVTAISNNAAGGVNKISSIYEPFQSSFSILTTSEDDINILFTNTFDERAEDYRKFERTIVVCEQVDKSISSVVDKYIIKMPKLEDWQIIDYAKILCPSVNNEDLSLFVKTLNSDIYAVKSELDKVALFSKNEQLDIFYSIRNDITKDAYKIDVFAISNAIIDCDMMALSNIFSTCNLDLIDPVVVANRAFMSLKNIILVSQNPALTAEDCRVSIGQFKFIKYNYRNINIAAAKRKLKFLAAFDMNLKSSKLDMSKRDMFNYLVNNTAFKITM